VSVCLYFLLSFVYLDSCFVVVVFGWGVYYSEILVGYTCIDKWEMELRGVRVFILRDYFYFHGSLVILVC